MLLILATWALAADPTPEAPAADAAQSLGPCGDEAPPIDLGDAQPAPALTPRDQRWLKPTRSVLPANPRGQTDYTAYTLEWGEVEAGLTYLSVGVLPGLQLSTVPAFYLPPALTAEDEAPLSPIWNVQAKLDVARLGPVDLAPVASYAAFDWPNLDARYLSIGGTVSVVVARPWSVHAGATWSSIGVRGVVPTDWLLTAIAGAAGSDVQSGSTSDGDGLGVAASLETLTVSLATDVRLNRRDSIVLQAQSLVWTDARIATTLETNGTSTALLDDELSGFVDPTQAYLATLSYQATFRNVDLRIGIGVPFDNPAWALQAFELAYRFGGPTRTAERKMLRGYRRSQKTDDAVTEAAAAPAEESGSAALDTY